MSDLFGKLKAGAGKVAFEADKLAKTQRVKSEMDQLNHALDSLYAGLGKAVYAQATTGGDPVAVEEWRVKIDEQKLRVQAKERELQAINAETYQQPGAAPAPRPAPAAPAAPIVPPPAPAEPVVPPVAAASEEPAPAARTCPNCGAAVPAQSKFCTECGTRMG